MFAIGQAMVVLVGTHIGAGRAERAKRIAWIGGALAACISLVIGAVAASVPLAWVGLWLLRERNARVGTALGVIALGLLLVQAGRQITWQFRDGTWKTRKMTTRRKPSFNRPRRPNKLR